MLIDTKAGFFRRIRATNTTDNAYPSVVDVVGFANKPSGTGNSASQTTARAVIDMIDNLIEGATPNWGKIMVYGVGSDNHVITLKLFTYTLAIDGGNLVTATWKVCPFAEVTCTLSANCAAVANGLEGGVTNLYADTMVLVGTSGDAGISMNIFSPADDATPAHIQFSLKGAHLLQPAFKRGSGTDSNGLIQLGN